MVFKLALLVIVLDSFCEAVANHVPKIEEVEDLDELLSTKRWEHNKICKHTGCLLALNLSNYGQREWERVGET